MSAKNGRNNTRLLGGSTCCAYPNCPNCIKMEYNKEPAECRLPPSAAVKHNIRLLNAENPCSPENCIIFGEHDIPYLQPFEPNICIKHVRRDKDDTFTLGFPVGVVSLNEPQKSDIVNQEQLRFATYLKAFGFCFFTPRSEWTAEIIERIIREGQLLYSDSQNMENPNANLRSEVYNESEEKITRYFKIDGYEFMVELKPPYESKMQKNCSNIVGNLKSIFKCFFRKAKHGLFRTANWYLLIWCDNGIYFVLDVNGRTVENLETNPDGLPMLIVLKSIDNVVYLIRHLSGILDSDKFSIRELLVTKLVLPQGEVIEREYGPRISQYEVVTSDYAYLKSNLHLTLNPKDPLRNRSALPVSIATILASKIDHPATWDMRAYDKVICYGVNMCKHCWEPCVDLTQPLDLDKFPRQIRMGQFVAEVLLTPNVYEGNWRCVPMYKNNDFYNIFEKGLSTNDYLLFQINNQMYAIWKKNNFIYLMDPYRHNIVGRILEEGEDPKSASIRMFNNLDRFLSVFHQMLLESNRSAIFHIHTLKIRNITECPMGTAPPLLPPDEEIEVISLNETINFTESYDKCLEELGEISDYEEDLASEIEPIEEISSSEEMFEEEEGGEGGPVEVEDIE